MYSLGFSASSQQPEALWKKRIQLLLLVMADGLIIASMGGFVKIDELNSASRGRCSVRFW
mgnify:CR=1 FL=1